jgi:hypothetical protein
MHLYLMHQSLINTVGWKDIAQVKVFQNYAKDQGQQLWYRIKGLFMRYLYVKYQNPIPYASKDIAQVKVLQN